MKNKKRLGRGLEALISAEEMLEEGISEIRINDVEPNLNQPRKVFDDEKIAELAKSIKKHGVVQPIIVKKEDTGYKIVAGERRWRAAKIAGLTTIPAVVKDLNSREMIEVTLIENLQREDLNPIEEAEAYERLIKEYRMTQEEISEIVGKSRPTIANSLRLLNLDEKVKESIVKGEVTSGHARALLALEKKENQRKVLDEIKEKNYNVRETEKLIKRINREEILEKKESENKERDNKKEIEIKALEEKLQGILGTRVKLIHGKKAGKIIIEYYSEEDLERILDIMRNGV
ncbi:MAG: ParB/RepB/Spo0J family partition protein [Clostridiaceae bacterium]|nr:ParB/RepB/Spo0J family partition protein [Clostridiaceae bacterium]